MKLTANPFRWFRHSINHNSGEREWHYIFSTRGWAAELAERHFDANMPDSHKYRGYRFEAARSVPEAIKLGYEAEMKRRTLNMLAPEMLVALKEMISEWEAHFPRMTNSSVSNAKRIIRNIYRLKRNVTFNSCEF